MMPWPAFQRDTGVPVRSPTLRPQLAGHFVQFYEDDRYLVNQVSAFLLSGMQGGGTAIVVATEPHRAALQRRLREAGYSCDAPGAVQYVEWDAAQTLAKFMVDGWPDASRFVDTIDPIIRHAGANGTNGKCIGSGQVWVFGEMVSVLAGEGKIDAAIRLEELWNELAKTHAFSLMCAYPLGLFNRESDERAFGRVCSAHGHVNPAESYVPPQSEKEFHRIIARLQQKAAALATEVEQRKQAEKKLLEREMELAKINQRKDEFLAMLGHELRNPLAPIATSLELMALQGDDQTRNARSREIIERQLALMTRLVDDLLDVSRITRGKIEMKKEMVLLSSIVERAVELTRALIDKLCHRLTVNLPAKPVQLYGDPARLAQVVANLLQNAAKYTNVGGQIKLAAQVVASEVSNREGAELVISVSDNGIGIAPGSRETIFDLFVQGGSLATQAPGGLGLGLTLVRNIVSLHGGRVAAISDGPGKGSEFVVRLPLRGTSVANTVANEVASEAANDARADPAQKTLSIARPLNILIVDDNTDTAESLEAFLTLSGHEVRIAHSGARAIEEAIREKPDVVLLDIGMPAMDGYEVAQRLRIDAGLESATLVAMTGFAQARDRKRALEAGFDHHLAKPLDLRKLDDVLVQTGGVSFLDRVPAV